MPGVGGEGVPERGGGLLRGGKGGGIKGIRIAWEVGRNNGIGIAREEKWNYHCRETNGIRIAGDTMELGLLGTQWNCRKELLRKQCI